MNGNYIVCNKRKSDGKLFFGERVRTYPTVDVAIAEAERRAKDCSDDYTYVVMNLLTVTISEKVAPPVRTTYA